MQADVYFTDGSLNKLLLNGAQTPNPVIAGNTAQYGANAANSVEVQFNGNTNNNCTVNLSVISGLPSGATATFSPASVTGVGSNESVFAAYYQHHFGCANGHVYIHDSGCESAKLPKQSSPHNHWYAGCDRPHRDDNNCDFQCQSVDLWRLCDFHRNGGASDWNWCADRKRKFQHSWHRYSRGHSGCHYRHDCNMDLHNNSNSTDRRQSYGLRLV